MESEAIGTGSEAVEADGKAYECSECGGRFATPAGLGAHRWHKHGVRGQARERGARGRRASKAVAPPEEETAYEEEAGSVEVGLTLPHKGAVVVKVRDSSGRMVGTMRLDHDGLSYRGPNSKRAHPAARIGWAKLQEVVDVFRG